MVSKVVLTIALILVGLVIMGIINTTLQEPNSTSKEGNDLKAIKIVQNFKGADEIGSTVTEVIVSIIRIAYGNEPIFDNPNTKFSWDSLRNFERQGNFYNVYVDFKAYDGSKEFHFIVDIDTNTIWAGNELASEILKVVESEG